MKKYAFTTAALIFIIVLAAFFTYFEGPEIFASGFILAKPGNLNQNLNQSLSQSPEPDLADPGKRILMPPVHAPENTIVLTEIPEVLDLTGLAVNPLSGLYINEETISRRPFAVVFNNNEVSLPQSGLSQADIIYEVISEGSITRIIGIFQDFTTAKIGSVRSARHYFIDIALDYDAFFVHFGGSPQAYQAIKDLRINSINGIYLDGGVIREDFSRATFWRDADRYSVARMREHSGYTNADNLIAYVQETGWRTEKREDVTYPFNFFEEFTIPEGPAANRISISYVGGNPCVFEYDSAAGKYSRFQNKGPDPQIDEETGEQITVDNVIVQLTSVKSIPGDEAGRRDVGIIGSGNGVLYTGGTSVPVKWSKSGHNNQTVWTYENGEPLTVNKGKTWICITNKQPEPEE